MPVNTLNFWCVTLTIPTTAAPLFGLVQTYFASNRTTATLDASAAGVAFQAGLGNGTTVIYLGDNTLSITGTPMVGVGYALSVSTPPLILASGYGGDTIDLNNFYVQASATATPYLNILVYKE